MRTQIELGKVLKFIPENTKSAFRVFLSANFERDPDGKPITELVTERYPIGFNNIILAIKDLRLLQSRLNPGFESWVSIDLSPIDVSRTLSKMHTSHFKAENAVFDKSEIESNLLYSNPIVTGVKIKKCDNYQTLIDLVRRKLHICYTEFEQSDSIIFLSKETNAELDINFFDYVQNFEYTNSVIELSYNKTDIRSNEERVLELNKKVKDALGN